MRPSVASDEAGHGTQAMRTVLGLMPALCPPYSGPVLLPRPLRARAAYASGMLRRLTPSHVRHSRCTAFSTATGHTNGGAGTCLRKTEREKRETALGRRRVGSCN